MSALEHEHLNGNLKTEGWSLDWHGAYDKDGSLDCSGLYLPGYVHLVFNVSGVGVVMGSRTRLGMATSTLALCFPQGLVRATRIEGGGNHEFVMLTMSVDWLKKTLGGELKTVYPVVWSFIQGSLDRSAPMGHIRSMSLSEREMAQQLTDPPVGEEAAPFWYLAKVTEMLSLHMFKPLGKG